MSSPLSLNPSVVGARAAAIVLGAFMIWAIADGLVAFVEYQLVNVPNGVLPSFGARAGLVTLGNVIGFVGLLLAIRYGSSDTHLHPSKLTLLLILLLALGAGAGIAASAWFPKEVAEAIGRFRRISELAAWGQESVRLSIFAIALRATVLILGFLYGATRWWLSARTCSESSPHA